MIEKRFVGLLDGANCWEVIIDGEPQGFDQVLPDPPLQPLDAVGALATLLAVTGTLTVQDAANAVQLTPSDLEHEALAWGAAAGANP